MSVAPTCTSIQGEVGQQLSMYYGPTGLALGDLNFDGLNDAFFTGPEYWTASEERKVHPIAMNNGGGEFKAIAPEDAPTTRVQTPRDTAP